MLDKWDLSLRIETYGYKIGDVFIALKGVSGINKGDILKLIHDDKSSAPKYELAFKHYDYETLIAGDEWYYPISWTRKLKVQCNET